MIKSLSPNTFFAHLCTTSIFIFLTFHMANKMLITSIHCHNTVSENIGDNDKYIFEKYLRHHHKLYEKTKTTDRKNNKGRYIPSNLEWFNQNTPSLKSDKKLASEGKIFNFPVISRGLRKRRSPQNRRNLLRQRPLNDFLYYDDVGYSNEEPYSLSYYQAFDSIRTHPKLFSKLISPNAKFNPPSAPFISSLKNSEEHSLMTKDNGNNYKNKRSHITTNGGKGSEKPPNTKLNDLPVALGEDQKSILNQYMTIMGTRKKYCGNVLIDMLQKLCASNYNDKIQNTAARIQHMRYKRSFRNYIVSPDNGEDDIVIADINADDNSNTNVNNGNEIIIEDFDEDAIHTQNGYSSSLDLNGTGSNSALANNIVTECCQKECTIFQLTAYCKATALPDTNIVLNNQKSRSGGNGQNLGNFLFTLKKLINNSA